jgi:hypothetical protein
MGGAQRPSTHRIRMIFCAATATISRKTCAWLCAASRFMPQRLSRAPALSLCCHLTLSWSPLSHDVFLASPLGLYQVKKILQDVCFILFGQSVLSIFSASVERPLPTCSWLTRLETRCFSLFETTNGCPIKTCGPQSQTQQPCEPRTG